MEETIARIIWNHELRRSGEQDDPYLEWPEHGFNDPRTWDYQETADAIIAAIGNPDATGDALTHIATGGGFVALHGPDHWNSQPSWIVKVWHGRSTSYVSGEGATPLAAITVALAAAES